MMNKEARSRVISVAQRYGYHPECKADGSDRYEKLIRLSHPHIPAPIFVHKDVGMNIDGQPKYFKLAVHPQMYLRRLEAYHADIRPAINQRSKENVHSHSGYSGLPLAEKHDEPIAFAYSVMSFDGLDVLLRELISTTSGGPNATTRKTTNLTASAPTNEFVAEGTHLEVPERGLIIAQPWIDLILRGEKTWEMRSTGCNVQGRIALIEKGTGHIVGTADLLNSVGPMRPSALRNAIDKHCITPDRMPDEKWMKKWNHAWVLCNAERLQRAVPYQHPAGAVIWVNLKQVVN